MAERKALGNAIGVRFTDDDGLAEAAAAFGILALEQVATTGAGAQHLAAGGDLETLGYRFLRSVAFGAAHRNSVSLQRARNIGTGGTLRKRYFCQRIFRTGKMRVPVARLKFDHRE